MTTAFESVHSANIPVVKLAKHAGEASVSAGSRLLACSTRLSTALDKIEPFLSRAIAKVDQSNFSFSKVFAKAFMARLSTTLPQILLKGDTHIAFLLVDGDII